MYEELIQNIFIKQYTTGPKQELIFFLSKKRAKKPSEIWNSPFSIFTMAPNIHHKLFQSPVASYLTMLIFCTTIQVVFDIRWIIGGGEVCTHQRSRIIILGGGISFSNLSTIASFRKKHHFVYFCFSLFCEFLYYM